MKNLKISYALLIIALTFSTIGIKAQEYNTKFGKVSQEEMDLKACPFDTMAEAMVLHDIGYLSFEIIGEKYQTLFERRMRIKVFKKAGLNQAEMSIPIYKGSSGSEKLLQVKGITYNMVNGEIVETSLSMKNAYEEKASEHWYNKKFAMPDVKEGSVFEISYKITSPYYTFLPTWRFQSVIPVRLSEYTMKVSPHFDYAQIMRGEGKLSDYQKYSDGGTPTMINNITYHDMIYKFTMNDVPAFKDEPFITSYNDYVRKIDFQLASIMYSNGEREIILSTWKKVCEQLIENESFGTYIKTWQRQGKNIIESLGIDPLTPLDKVQRISQYVKSNVIFNGNESLFATKSQSKVAEEKTGNSADINLMALGLMKAAGFEAYPVILSTRDHGKLQTLYPFVDAFNYVITLVNVDSVMYLVDATDPLSKFNEIPPNCLNELGYIVRDENPDWINFQSMGMSEKKYEIDILPKPEIDSLDVNYKITSTGYEALDHRKRFKLDYEGLAKDLIGDNYLSYDSIQSTNLTDINEPFMLAYKKPEYIEKVENKLIINPFCGSVLTENPFKETVRVHPIDFNYKWSKSYSVNIKIPKGYRLLSKPENLVMNNKIVRIVYAVTNNDPEVLVVTGLYQFKKDVYGAEDYQQIKDYYNAIVSKFNEKIVLEASDI